MQAFGDHNITLPYGASGDVRTTCPQCDNTSLAVQTTEGLWYCHYCGWGGSLRGRRNGKASCFRQRQNIPKRPDPAASAWKQAAILRTWNQARSITKDTPAGRYLQRRSLWPDDPAPFPPTLRYTPRLAYRHDDSTYTHHPALVALVQRLDGKVTTLHRTYLTADGRKADVPTPKRTMPTPTTMKEAAVRLGEAGETLAVTEGIETGLAVRHMLDVSVWAGLSAIGMQTVQLPDTVTLVLVCPDHDTAGLRAGRHLAQRMLAEDRRVKLLIPPRAGQDWADVLIEEGGAA